MHGRLKVKDSAEKAAEKARGREIKRKKYLAGIHSLFQKRDAEEHDSEALGISAALLLANPDALTLWNTRRNTLLHLRAQYTKEDEGTKKATEQPGESAAADTSISETEDKASSTERSDTKVESRTESTGAIADNTDGESSAVKSSIAQSLTSTKEAPSVNNTTAAPSVQNIAAPSVNNTTAAPSVQRSTAPSVQNIAAPSVQRSAAPSVQRSAAPLSNRWHSLLETELSVVSGCLQHNPKSYGAWHHRVWILQQIAQSATSEEQRNDAWMKELALCNLFLTKDERNFHCWDYRRLVVRNGGVAILQELRYSLRLIETNFSNYSAWHYRSKLLPQLEPPQQGSEHPVKEETLAQELERVKQAVFTDPSDQSPWFYLRWLLKRTPHTARPVGVSVVPLSAPPAAPRLLLVCSYSGGGARPPPLPPQRTWDKHGAGLWSCQMSEVPVELQVSDDVTVDLTPIRGTEGGTIWLPSTTTTSCASQQTVQALQQLVEDCQLLDQIDPNNKWVLLTLVEALWSLGGAPNCTLAATHLASLAHIDQLRHGYYTDTRSKLLLELECQGITGDAGIHGLEARSLGLTRLHCTERLYACPTATLAGNSLTGAGLNKLLLCTQLDLDGNTALDTLVPVSKLPRLTRLSLNDCHLEHSDMLTPLLDCKTLRCLEVAGNFQQQQDREEVIVQIKQNFSHLEQLVI